MTIDSKVLALKYRPQVFEDLIGQNVVVETISNGIKAKKTGNAYLFTGIRGVGKTTTARIVAKALNCLNGIENLCKENMCEHCEAITNSNHIDVLEMDAASKTGVDDVRDLIEFSRYGPTSAKYKIFIIDEVHMLSKQAFNALLKTLEEPPLYNNGGSLKFLFCTTEIKKIPITVVSRCQRFDLSRINSIELFEFIKKVKDKENGKVTDDALKLIVKLSEGSVRDALSLLDRTLVSQEKDKEINLNKAQKIFNYLNKSTLIELFRYLFEGNEKKVVEIYRSIYDQGVDPKIFLNDFLEILYYLKNISSLKIDGTNFTLNDEEFNRIKELGHIVSNQTLLLFWQFTIKTLEEIEFVSNQHIAIEMFLIRIVYLIEISDLSKKNKDNNSETASVNQLDTISVEKKNIKEELFDKKNKTIGQIKNIIQEKKQTEKLVLDNIKQTNAKIKTFGELIDLCNSKKEIKLKYELETNVNLVSFENQRIEISFNEKLDKDFIKNLSSKLYEWTNDRWIISLSKKSGELSKKEKDIIKKKEILENKKKGKTYKKILETFPDAELINMEENND